ncbi:hypothetical protein KC315_g4563, partial [Hortaea werneckii]
MLSASEWKAQKRSRQAVKKKEEEDVVPEEDYSRQDSQQAAEDRAQAIFNKAEKLQVPADARLTSIVEQRETNGLL